MIKIEQEPQELHCQFENCVFCDKPTGWWHVKTNRPVCKLCSEINNEEDILKAKYNY
jgi:hypothetical protein